MKNLTDLLSRLTRTHRGEPSTRCHELKAQLDGLVARADTEDLPGEERVVFEDAALKFVAGGPALLNEATEFLWAYYSSVAEGFSSGLRREYGVPELKRTRDIWEQVTFEHPPEVRLGAESELEPSAAYISFEGEVSWEPEHGLQLVFENGAKLCKVGPYDGHMTNARAIGDASLLNIIFRH